MDDANDLVNEILLDSWQRDFPIEPRPFDRLAEALNITTEDVLHRLRENRKNGRVTRVGATCAPNTVSASTLAV